MSIRYAFVIVLAAAIIFILVGQPVIASSMDHYDLASLYYMASVVVEVTEGEYKRVKEMDVGEVTVLKVHKGNVKIGEKLMVAFKAHSRKMSVLNSLVVTRVDGKPPYETMVPPKFNKALLFLSWMNFNAYAPCANAGCLIAEDGSVYGFRQDRSPGPYELVNQTPDFLKLKKGEVFDEAKLQVELELAKKHVQEFETALAGGKPESITTYIKRPWNASDFEFWNL